MSKLIPCCSFERFLWAWHVGTNPRKHTHTPLLMLILQEAIVIHFCIILLLIITQYPFTSCSRRHLLYFLHSDTHVETWIPCQWIILQIPVVFQYHTIAPMLECDVDSTLINNSCMIDTLNPVNSFFSAWISAVILLFRLDSTEKELLRSLAHLTLLENCLACVLMIPYFTHMPSIHLPPVTSHLFFIVSFHLWLSILSRNHCTCNFPFQYYTGLFGFKFIVSCVVDDCWEHITNLACVETSCVKKHRKHTVRSQLHSGSKEKSSSSRESLWLWLLCTCRNWCRMS